MLNKTHLIFCVKNKLKKYKFIAKPYFLIKDSWRSFEKKKRLYPLAIQRKLPIKYISIEPSSSCNLNCKWCIVDKKNRGFMDLSLFKNLLQQIADKEASCEELGLVGGGEVMLHPQFEQIIDILAGYKSDYPDFPRTVTITNGTLLNEKLSRHIIETKALDAVRFSIDGGTKEKFERIRVGAKWDKTIETVNNFIDLKEKLNSSIEIHIISIIEPTLKISREFNLLINRIDRYLPRIPHNWTGEMEFEDLDKSNYLPKQGLCDYILWGPQIRWNGLVSPCCVDLNIKGPVGDANKQKIKDIFNNEKRLAMLKNMYRNERWKNSLCKNCSA